ncbi:MAG: hypothetical protein AAGB26_00730 [Planctomycetota bacterium]
MSKDHPHYETRTHQIKPTPAHGTPCELIGKMWVIRDLIDQIKLNSNPGIAIGKEHIDASIAARVHVESQIEEVGEVELGRAILDHFGGFRAAEDGLGSLAAAMDQAIHFPGSVPNLPQPLLGSSSINRIHELLMGCVLSVARLDNE